MPESDASYGSLAQAARTKALGRAKVLLWVVGLLTIAVNGFQFAFAEKALDAAVDKELRASGGSLAEVRGRNPEDRAKFDAAYAKGLRQLRLVLGANVVLGLLFLGCALMVSRRPVAATVTGLVVYLGSTAALAALDPTLLARGFVWKIVVIAGLAAAVKAAFAVERAARAPAAP